MKRLLAGQSSFSFLASWGSTTGLTVGFVLGPASAPESLLVRFSVLVFCPAALLSSVFFCGSSVVAASSQSQGVSIFASSLGDLASAGELPFKCLFSSFSCLFSSFNVFNNSSFAVIFHSYNPAPCTVRLGHLIAQ